MTRQEEADEVIKDVAEYSTPQIVVQKAHEYANKYLKPKDPLFEKYCELINWFQPRGHLKFQDKEVFDKFKEIFKEELNGTKGLDEAIKKIWREHHYVGEQVIDIIEEIKEKLEAE